MPHFEARVCLFVWLVQMKGSFKKSVSGGGRGNCHFCDTVMKHLRGESVRLLPLRNAKNFLVQDHIIPLYVMLYYNILITYYTITGE